MVGLWLDVNDRNYLTKHARNYSKEKIAYKYNKIAVVKRGKMSVLFRCPSDFWEMF